eukprot:SAG22_NODE_451_length_10354_cov_5.184983_2_plen_276_part_00
MRSNETESHGSIHPCCLSRARDDLDRSAAEARLLQLALSWVSDSSSAIARIALFVALVYTEVIQESHWSLGLKTPEAKDGEHRLLTGTAAPSPRARLALSDRPSAHDEAEQINTAAEELSTPRESSPGTAREARRIEGSVRSAVSSGEHGQPATAAAEDRPAAASMSARVSTTSRSARRTPGSDGESDETERKAKMEALQKDKQELLDGTHGPYTATITKLEKDRDEKEGKADRTKQLRLKYIAAIYDAECKQVDDEFEVRRPRAVVLMVGATVF